MGKKLRRLKNHPCPLFIGVQVKYFRKKNQMTQRELSEITEIKLRHLQKIEAGEVDIKLSTLGALSRGLGITPDTLLYPIESNFKLICAECSRNRKLLVSGKGLT